jgi:hypothetical protein
MVGEGAIDPIEPFIPGPHVGLHRGIDGDLGLRERGLKGGDLFLDRSALASERRTLPLGGGD